jgi:hypothetical protein
MNGSLPYLPQFRLWRWNGVIVMHVLLSDVLMALDGADW